jgi:hypothetical protein
MKKFILFYKGPATPPDASHEGWPDWFGKLGDKLVDAGSPLINGISVHTDGSKEESTVHLNGYSIVQANDKEALLDLVKDHPYLSQGKNVFTIEVFELPS